MSASGKCISMAIENISNRVVRNPENHRNESGGDATIRDAPQRLPRHRVYLGGFQDSALRHYRNYGNSICTMRDCSEIIFPNGAQKTTVPQDRLHVEQPRDVVHAGQHNIQRALLNVDSQHQMNVIAE